MAWSFTQRYDCYPGKMKVEPDTAGEAGCEHAGLPATVADLSSSPRR